MELDQLQEDHREWMEHNFPNAEPWEALVGLAEEVGELAHAHLKGFNKIRGLDTEFAIQRKKEDAIGDIVIYLSSYCNTNGIDLNVAVEMAWIEVSARDWVKFPTNGRTE